jgi:hypothetical protein
VLTLHTSLGISFRKLLFGLNDSSRFLERPAPQVYVFLFRAGGAIEERHYLLKTRRWRKQQQLQKIPSAPNQRVKRAAKAAISGFLNEICQGIWRRGAKGHSSPSLSRVRQEHRSQSEIL